MTKLEGEFIEGFTTCATCPECGSTDIVIKRYVRGAALYCGSCKLHFTEWQQEQIERLCKMVLELEQLHLADKQTIRNQEAKFAKPKT
jgi:transposase-like protein